MTYFAIICSIKKFQENFELSEVLITYVTHSVKARVMFQIGAGHGNKCKIILKLFESDIFGNNLQHKKIQAQLEVSDVLTTYVTNRGKARVMLQIGTGHSNTCQIILKLFGYDIFCNNLQHKKISSKFRSITDVNHLC